MLLKNFKEKNTHSWNWTLKSTYQKSIDLKIPTINKFFGVDLVRNYYSWQNKSFIANNVYAHVPNIKILLKHLKIS